MKHIGAALVFRISIVVSLALAADRATAEDQTSNNPTNEEKFVKANAYANFQSSERTGEEANYTRHSTPCFGEWLFPTGKSNDLNDYNAVFVGGLWDPRKPFQQFVDKWGMPGFYIVPAKSKLGDLLRLGRIKLVGQSDPFARDLAESIRTVKRKLAIYALSQGVLATVNAIKYHGMSNHHSFIFFSPALSHAAIRRNIPEDNFYYSVPWFDASSVWAPSHNPLRFLAGLTDLACGACMHWRKSINYHFLLYHMRKQHPNDKVRIKTIRNERGERERVIEIVKRKPSRQ